MYQILLKKPNYSQFVRIACKEKLGREGNKEIIKQERQQLHKRLKELDEMEKHSGLVDEATHEILLSGYKEWLRVKASYEIPSDRGVVDHWGTNQMLNWIQSNVLPKLKTAGSDAYKAEEVLEIYAQGKLKEGNGV